MNKKEKQKTIPSIKLLTSFDSMTGKELRKFVLDYVKTNLAGNTIVNDDTKLRRCGQK